MPLQTALTVLTGNAAVTALVSDRISPVETEQATDFPCVVLTVSTVEPVNHLRGFANLDQCTVRLSAWAFTYASALAIANACRSALEAAGHLCIGRFADEFGLEKDPGAYRVGYEFRIWK